MRDPKLDDAYIEGERFVRRQKIKIGLIVVILLLAWVLR